MKPTNISRGALRAAGISGGAAVFLGALLVAGCGSEPQSLVDGAETAVAGEVAQGPIRADEMRGERPLQSPAQPERRSSVAQRGRRPGLQHDRRPPPAADKAFFPTEFRAIDGGNNNLNHPEWGAADTPLLRLTTVSYDDGIAAPARPDAPGAREVRNAICAQLEMVDNSRHASDYLWQWGQFLDHDIDETPVADPAEPLDITVPTGDAWFDPDGSGTVTIGFDRSSYAIVDGVRQQVNGITAFIDASNVYGSESSRTLALRALDGTGRLKTSAGDLLPFNEEGLPNAGGPGAELFLAGDVRCNEQVGLTCMHTLFMREHNYWADRVRAARPDLSGDDVFDIARAIVGAEMQAITSNEFLPLLLGPNALGPYRGYQNDVNPGIANVFATAAYRVGHTMLSTQLRRMDAAGQTIPDGDLSLTDAFFNVDAVQSVGIEPVLRGLAWQHAQEIDARLVDDVRNFLFGPPGAGGFDLAALNIQRGRDHGLPTLNQIRIDYGLPPYASFAELTDDPEMQQKLLDTYGAIDQVEIWVGGLTEPHINGAMVGETFYTILVDQFQRLRDGDRFWYQRYFSADMVALIDNQPLARIIRRNTPIRAEVPNKVLLVSQVGDRGRHVGHDRGAGHEPGLSRGELLTLQRALSDRP